MACKEMSQYVQSFTEYLDAVSWLEKHLEEVPKDFEIYNAGINYMNGRWRVGLSVGPAEERQEELFNE